MTTTRPTTNLLRPLGFAALALLLLAQPAAAQRPDDDLERQVSRAVSEAISSSVESSLRDVNAGVREALGELARDDVWHGRQGSNRSGSRGDVVDRQTRPLKLDAHGTLDISSISGDITITAGTGPATLDIVRRGSARTSTSSRQTAAQMPFTVDERTGVVRVREVGSVNGLSVSFNVVVPAGTEVTATSIAGDITITGVHGDLHVRNNGGDITLTSVGSVGMAHSIGGSVTISGAETDGSITASSIGGEITLSHIKSRELHVDSISGEISVADAAARQVSVEASNGSVFYQGPLARGGHYDLRSHNGSIRMEPQGPVGFEIEAHTYSGDITFDRTLAVKTTSSSRRAITGTSGDGDATINIVTFNGSVTIGKSRKN